jgi:hypothetical protein
MMRRGVQALLSILLLALAIAPDASAQFFSRSFSIPPDSGELQLIKFEKQSDHWSKPRWAAASTRTANPEHFPIPN